MSLTFVTLNICHNLGQKKIVIKMWSQTPSSKISICFQYLILLLASLLGISIPTLKQNDISFSFKFLLMILLLGNYSTFIHNDFYFSEKFISHMICTLISFKLKNDPKSHQSHLEGACQLRLTCVAPEQTLTMMTSFKWLK